MNQQQKKYAVLRIEEETEKLFLKAKAKYVIAAKTPSPREKLALLQKGKVKFASNALLVSKCRIDRRGVYQPGGPNTTEEYLSTPGYLCTDLDFSKYETKEKITAKYEPAMKKIRKKAKMLTDELMLGDAETALKTIKTFAKMEI